MNLDIDITLKIPWLAKLRPAKLDAATRAALHPAVSEAVLLVEHHVKKRTPVGATEAARGSIQSAVELVRGRRLEVRGTVTSALDYIVPLEKGSRPHWAPIGPLKLWARRVLGNEGLAYAVRAAIAKRGTKGKFMFRDGFLAAKPKAQAIMEEGARKWTALLKR